MKIITLLHNSAQKKCLHKIKNFEKYFKIEFVTPVDKHDKNKLVWTFHVPTVMLQLKNTGHTMS